MDRRIALIAASAATLADRLGPDWRADQSAASRTLAAARMARWRDRVAPGDDAAFVARLGWIGVDADAVLPQLGDGRFTLLPDWTEFLAAALTRPPEVAGAERHPFGRLLGGFVAEALARLPEICTEAYGAKARATLIDDLLTKLSYLAAPALQIEFVAIRGERVGDGDARFQAFVAHMTAGGLVDFFTEYAALARLMAITSRQWIAHVGALAQDFVADRAGVAERFGDSPAAQIIAIAPSLSDAHNEGRSVAIVTLSSGRRLAYKPRSVGIEARWFALLAALDGTAGSFRSLAVLDCGTRGWVELAEHRACADADDASGYYRRAGNLLALLYALEASDCFHENIVAEGGFPVLIDMETLMHPLIRPRVRDEDAGAAADDMLFDSVLRAGLLPTWEAGRDGVVVDISGLGAEARQTTPYLRRRWTAINADAMTLHHEAIVVDSLHHLPMLDGAALRVADHAASLVDGFRETYCALIARRDSLLAADGPIAAMAADMLRLVFHPTRLYGLLLKRMSTPKAMRCGIERSIEFDVLARFYLNNPAKTDYRGLLGAELTALERGDIPYFVLRADSRDLPVPGAAPIRDAFAHTAIARVTARLKRFDDADLTRQTEFIRASLVMSAALAHATPAVARVADSVDDAPPVTADDLRAAAVAIGDSLRAQAITADDGSVTWIAPQLMPHAPRFELRPLRRDLYGGQAGVALFLAALARETGVGGDLARAALAPLRRNAMPKTLAAMLASGHTIGGATGIGSIVYALTRCADLLGASELLDDAAAAAAMLTPAAIAADDEHDVMAGAAGAALGLLALYRATGDATVLNAARQCGDHLLSRAQPMAVGIAWASGHHPPTTGLSHGAAGIALALSRLAAATGDARFGDAAEAALAFEAAAFDAAHGNWRDLRGGPDAPMTFMNAWCHGGLGIGLARAAMPRGVDAGARAADITAAVSLNDGDWLSGKDGLCCGNLSRVELMLAVDRPESAQAIASRVLARAAYRGQFALSGGRGVELFDPSFFQGLSGIGYQLLRLRSDGALPSVLVWE